MRSGWTRRAGFGVLSAFCGEIRPRACTGGAGACARFLRGGSENTLGLRSENTVFPFEIRPLTGRMFAAGEVQSPAATPRPVMEALMSSADDTLSSALYKAIDVTACIYCGLVADSLDHVIPRAWVSIARRKGRGDLGYRVPACMECNSLLGSKALHTVEERKEFIFKRLQSRYRHTLRVPHWWDTELDELGPRLRQMVEAYQKARRITEYRIKFASELHVRIEKIRDCEREAERRRDEFWPRLSLKERHARIIADWFDADEATGAGAGDDR